MIRNAQIDHEAALDNRNEFEQWASDQGKWPRAVERNGEGYILVVTNIYWQAWKARGESREITMLREALAEAASGCPILDSINR